MKEVVIKVSEDTVNEIQLKDFEAIGMKSVIATLLEAHSEDANTRLLDSPVFVSYQSRMSAKLREFEQAKDKMINDYVDAELQKKVASWNLNYGTCELVLQVQE